MRTFYLDELYPQQNHQITEKLRPLLLKMTKLCVRVSHKSSSQLQFFCSTAITMVGHGPVVLRFGGFL